MESLRSLQHVGVISPAQPLQKILLVAQRLRERTAWGSAADGLQQTGS